ncbi:MAG: TonB-dependent receptor [Steroidobacteraceae bacterium]
MHRFSKPSRILAMAFAAVLPFSLHAQETTLEEVVVTAQKRTEDLQRVGISVSAFRAEDLRDLGANSLSDVIKFVSDVQLYDEYGSGQPTWVIRGVGLQDFNANNTPTAAIYIDDVYITSNVMGGQSLFDLERVEVLKGPQGALYGRNTSGGAVRVISQRPDPKQISGYVNGGFGRWDRMSSEGAVNIPLGEGSAMRLAGRWDYSDKGWQKNVITGQNHGKQDRWAVRGSFLTALGSSGEALLRVHGSEDKSETVLAQTIGVYDPVTFDYCAPLLAGHIDNSHCAAYATFFDPEFRFPDVQSADGSTTLSSPINRLDNQSVGGSLALTFELGSATLTSITGYEDFHYGMIFDYDGGFGEFSTSDAKTDIKAFSQELRLTSAQDGPFQWMAGLEYAKDDLIEDRRYLYKDDTLILANPAVLGGQAVAIGYKQNTESWAAWTQANYQLTNTLKLNAGVRYTDETKSYKNGNTTVLDNGQPIPLYQNLSSDMSMNMWSGKVSLDWSVADGALVYVSVARGFKSGGFFGGFPGSGEASIYPYDPETNMAYEVGLKSQWLRNTLRFNAAVFHYDYADAQGYRSVKDPNGLVFTRLSNVGDAEHDGVEAELMWLPTERLSLQASGAWLDARITHSDVFTTSRVDGSLVPLEGRKRPSSPKWSYNAIGRYTLPVGQTLKSTLQLDYNWRDSLAGDGASAFERALGGLQKAYGLLGARLSLTSTKGSWEVALWGRNILGEKYITNVTTDDIASWIQIPGEPRSYGIEASYKW